MRLTSILDETGRRELGSDGLIVGFLTFKLVPRLVEQLPLFQSFLRIVGPSRRSYLNALGHASEEPDSRAWYGECGELSRNTIILDR